MASVHSQSNGTGVGGGGGGARGIGKGALVSRETRCELSFCAMPLPNILKKASSYILGDTCQDSLRAMYQVRIILFLFYNLEYLDILMPVLHLCTIAGFRPLFVVAQITIFAWELSLITVLMY